MDYLYELPLGLRHELTQNRNALDYWNSLSAIAKVQLINHAETLHSQEEMSAFVSSFPGADY